MSAKNRSGPVQNKADLKGFMKDPRMGLADLKYKGTVAALTAYLASFTK